MKHLFACILGAAGMAALASADDPTITMGSVTPSADGRVVTISYNLEDTAVVTMDVLTNNASIGSANISGLYGDVNTRVSAGNGRTITWRPHSAFPGLKAADGTVRIKLTAWPLNNPPRFLAVDIQTGTQAYYIDEASVPGGITADEYKTTKLLLRKIEAKDKTFSMGAPSDEVGRTQWTEGAQYGKQDYPAQVKFTNDFYIGVYEFTVRQWELVTKSDVTSKATVGWKGVRKDKLPITGITWTEARGGTFSGYATSTIAADSIVGKLRTATSNTLEFELPTEAQWEYACRAGTTTALYNGKSLSDATTSPELNKICRYASNGGIVSGANQGPAEVGTLEPNAFGLYDMLGNVGEFCRDQLDWNCNGMNLNGNITNIEPCGYSSNARIQRRARGGDWAAPASYCRCAARPSDDNRTIGAGITWYSNKDGFRLSITLVR